MNEIIEQISDYSMCHIKNDFLNTLFGNRCNDVTSGAVPVALFGAGAVGRELCQVLQLHYVLPDCFCDNNPKEIGSSYFNVQVIAFKEFKKLYKNHLVVVASIMYESEIRKQLMENGFPAEQLISLSSLNKQALRYLGYYFNCNYYTKNPRHSLSINYLENHQEEVSQGYNLLSDKKSKDIFIGRLSLFTSKMDFLKFSNFIINFSELNEKERDEFPFYVSPEDYGYFNNDVFRLEDDELLIDGGSYNGLSACTFAKICERNKLTYKKIFCFEPSCGNFEILKSNTAHLHDIEYIKKGLWSHSTTLNFLSQNVNDPGAVIEDCSDKMNEKEAIRTQVQTVSIDEQLINEKVTYIKMDIEGAEIEAIKGAANVIKRYQPKLAISAYHKHSDIYELQLLIHKICPKYKFYLRHYGYTLFDTVLFAIPQR